MVDWNGLFKWSMNHQDGTKPSEFKQMSKEDRTWLEEALKSYTFNDVDRMKEICEELEKYHKTMHRDILLDGLDELLELVEMHPRSSLNLCLCGGMKTVLEIIFNSEKNDARKAACALLSSAVQNNKEVQQIMQKMGILNLMHQYIKESEIANKEAVIGALAQYLKGENFKGKLEFITESSGLAFLREVLLQIPIDQIRHTKKIIMLLYDFLLSDDQLKIEENEKYMREILANDQTLINHLIEILNADLQTNEDILNHQKHDRREYLLKIFEYLVNYRKQELLTQIKPSLNKLKEQISTVKQQHDQNEYLELLDRELEQIEKIEQTVDGRNIQSNYDLGEFKPVLHIKDNEEEEKQQKPLAIGI
eukprot:403363538